MLCLTHYNSRQYVKCQIFKSSPKSRHLFVLSMDKRDSNQTCLLNMFLGTSLVVPQIRLCFYCGDLRSLLRELRSHMLRSTAKKKKKKDVSYNEKLVRVQQFYSLHCPFIYLTNIHGILTTAQCSENKSSNGEKQMWSLTILDSQSHVLSKQATKTYQHIVVLSVGKYHLRNKQDVEMKKTVEQVLMQ